MALNLANLETKLAAIRAKDVDAICKAHSYIPGLARDYTEDDLRKWLQARIDVLEGARTMTAKSQTDAAVSAVTSKLSVADKAIADKIAAGAEYTLDEKCDYESLVKVMLYKFVTEPA
jgi:hypothetical protein